MSGVYNCLAKYLFGVRLCRGLVLLEPELSSIPNWEVSKLFLLYVGNSFHRGKTDILVGMELSWVGMGSLRVPGVDMGLQWC